MLWIGLLALLAVTAVVVGRMLRGAGGRAGTVPIGGGDSRNFEAQHRQAVAEFPVDPDSGSWSLRRKDFGHGFAFVLVDPEGEEQPLRTEGRQQDGFKSTEIVGEKHYVQELHQPAFMAGREIRLVLERDNPHDAEAVSVRSLDDQLTAGYLARRSRTRPKVLELIEQGTPPRAFVQWRSVTPDGETARLRILILMPGTVFKAVS